MLADAHEFAEYASVLPRVVLRDNELHARRVHAVSEGSDHRKVGHAQQGVEFILLERLMTRGPARLGRDAAGHEGDILVVHGDKVEASVLAVNVGHELTDHALELGRIGERGARHLDHDDVAHPFRVVLQELFERAKLYNRNRAALVK